jgi:hypothetical protein
VAIALAIAAMNESAGHQSRTKESCGTMWRSCDSGDMSSVNAEDYLGEPSRYSLVSHRRSVFVGEEPAKANGLKKPPSKVACRQDED